MAKAAVCCIGEAFLAIEIESNKDKSSAADSHHLHKGVSFLSHHFGGPLRIDPPPYDA